MSAGARTFLDDTGSASRGTQVEGMSARSDFLAAAVALSELGYAAIPLSVARKPTQKGWPAAGAGLAETRERFKRDPAGLAIVVRAGMMVIDLDRGHVDGIDGLKTFASLVRKNDGDFPRNGPRARSRRGGLHLYLRAPDNFVARSSTSVLGAGIDCKGARSCVTAPPTPGYAWVARPVRVEKVPLAPTWLIRAVAARRSTFVSRAPVLIGPDRASYPQAVIEGEILAVATCGVGQRNSTLFKAAARLGGLCAAGALAPDRVARALLAAAKHCGLADDDGDAAVAKTIASGLRAGFSSPRHIPSRR